MPLAPCAGAGGRVGKVTLSQHTRGHGASDSTLVPQQVCRDSLHVLNVLKKIWLETEIP